jgi:hypothetical protein
MDGPLEPGIAVRAEAKLERRCLIKVLFVSAGPIGAAAASFDIRPADSALRAHPPYRYGAASCSIRQGRPRSNHAPMMGSRLASSSAVQTLMLVAQKP